MGPMRKTVNAVGDAIDEPKLSETDRRQRNQYLREFLPAMTGYAVILTAVLSFVDEDSASARYWYLLPVLPMIAMGFALFRSLQRADEYTRLIQLEAMGLGFAGALLASLVMGFLGVAGVSTTYAGWLIFGVGMGTWGLAFGLRGH